MSPFAAPPHTGYTCLVNKATSDSAPPFEVGWLAQRPFAWFSQAFRRQIAQLTSWPTPQDYNEIVRMTAEALGSDGDRPHSPRFLKYAREPVRAAGGYEAYVAQERAVPTRPFHFHDFFNMAVWAHFPRWRWALNRLHTSADPGEVDPRNGRTPLQNHAAHFDETGMLVVSQDADVLTNLAELRFKRVFWERRCELQASTRFYLVGHGMLEAMRAPVVGLMAKAVFVRASSLPSSTSAGLSDVDRLLADQVCRWPRERGVLHPVPLLGVPGFHAEQTSQFYDNPRYFRAQRSGSRA